LHARRAVVVLNDIAAYYWQGLARFLATLPPRPVAIPSSATRRVSRQDDCGTLTPRPATLPCAWRLGHSTRAP